MIQFFFVYFSVVVLILSLVVVTRRNPIHAVLAMLIMFFHIAGLYILLNAEFLAAVQVIVYAGAILVLFLFAIMVLNLKEELTIQTYVGSWSVAIAAAGGVFLIVVFGLMGVKVPRLGPHSIEYIQNTTHSKALGKEMFVTYLLPFEVVSVILLVAIIGAIVLAKKKMKE